MSKACNAAQFVPSTDCSKATAPAEIPVVLCTCSRTPLYCSHAVAEPSVVRMLLLAVCAAGPVAETFEQNTTGSELVGLVKP